ncbi:hypothetical protein FACS189430_03900 [Bacteroidia bacterium]|nr:hypothetical protein FACS189430_03900 [Bacteroidia bacterium]
MKKTIIQLVSGAFALMLGGCGFFGANVTDQKSINDCFPSKLEKDVDPQTVVFSLMMSTTQDFSFDMDVASIKCLEPNAAEPVQLNFTLTGNQKPRRLKASVDIDFSNPGKIKKLEAANGIKLNEIDFSQVASNVNKAIEMLKAKGSQADGVKSYNMTFTGNPKETKHSFLVRCKGGTNLGTNNRGAAAFVTEYSEFTFTADSEGNVSVEE